MEWAKAPQHVIDLYRSPNNFEVFGDNWHVFKAFMLFGGADWQYQQINTGSSIKMHPTGLLATSIKSIVDLHSGDSLALFKNIRLIESGFLGAINK